MYIIVPINAQDRFISSTAPETGGYTEYNPATTYVAGDFCKISSLHKIYKCLSSTYVDSGGTSHEILNYYPPDWLVTANSTYPWQEYATDNKWACIDEYVNTLSSCDSGEMIYNFDCGGCNSVALLNLSASSVTLNIYNSDGSLYSTETTETYRHVDTLEELFVSPPERKQNIFFKFSLGLSGIMQLVIKNDFGTVRCGVISIGRLKYIGKTTGEVQKIFNNYSSFQTDSLGRTKIAQGFYSYSPKFNVKIEKSLLSSVSKTIIDNRANNIVCVIDNVEDPNLAEPELLVYGYIAGFTQTLRKTHYSGELTIAGAV